MNQDRDLTKSQNDPFRSSCSLFGLIVLCTQFIALGFKQASFPPGSACLLTVSKLQLQQEIPPWLFCSFTQSLKTRSQWSTTHWLLQYSSSHSVFLMLGRPHPTRMHLVAPETSCDAFEEPEEETRTLDTGKTWPVILSYASFS